MPIILEILVTDNKILFLLNNNLSLLGIISLQMILGGNSIRIVQFFVDPDLGTLQEI